MDRPTTASFEYSDEWLDAPLSYPLDPVNLPLLQKTFTTTNPAGVFGVMLDAGPDDRGSKIGLRDLGADRSTCLIERFDRQPGKPAHLISANNRWRGGPPDNGSGAGG